MNVVTLVAALVGFAPSNAAVDAWKPLPDSNCCDDHMIMGLQLEARRDGPQPARLLCGCAHGKPEVSLVPGPFSLGAAATARARVVELQFDGGVPVRQSWTVLADRAALLAPEPDTLLRRFASSDSLRVRLRSQDGPPALLRFDVGGFDRHRGEVESICRRLAALEAASAPKSGLPAYDDYVFVEELPEAITKVEPVYPSVAKRDGLEGTVLVSALIGPDGRVHDTKVVKSVPALDAAAVEAVRQWTFKPGRTGGKPIGMWMALPIRFSRF